MSILNISKLRVRLIAAFALITIALAWSTPSKAYSYTGYGIKAEIIDSVAHEAGILIGNVSSDTLEIPVTVSIDGGQYAVTRLLTNMADFDRDSMILTVKHVELPEGLIAIDPSVFLTHQNLNQ